jgi:hypothetical protein
MGRARRLWVVIRKNVAQNVSFMIVNVFVAVVGDLFLSLDGLHSIDCLGGLHII